MQLVCGKNETGQTATGSGGGDAEIGARVTYDYDLSGQTPGAKPKAPAWVCAVLGDDFFAEVGLVDGPGKFSDADMKSLDGLAHIHYLLIGGSNITDAGLKYMRKSRQLYLLDIKEAKITDAGLENFQSLTELQVLDLAFTAVGDAGLEYLKGLSQLQRTRTLPNSYQRRRAGQS